MIKIVRDDNQIHDKEIGRNCDSKESTKIYFLGIKVYEYSGSFKEKLRENNEKKIGF